MKYGNIDATSSGTIAAADSIVFVDADDSNKLKKDTVQGILDLGGGSGIANVVEDTTPQLGGNLDLNGNTVGDATAADLTKLNGVTATVTELNYVDGVTSAIQTQVDAKAPVADPTFTGEIGIGAVNVSETELGILEGATLTTTELNYVDGVTSAIQTQIDQQKEVIGIACSDETTDLAVADDVATFRMPFAMTLTEVRATVTTAPVGSTIIVDIEESGTTVLSTLLTIDASEKTSETAATPPVISDSALADDAEISINIDQIGSSTAGKGLKIWLIGTRA